MAMEVVWTRAFTPVLKTQVYSFAWIVFTYLGATFAGSLTYRRNLRAGSVHSMAELMFFLAIAAFFPIFANDYRLMTWVSTGNQALETSRPGSRSSWRPTLTTVR